LTPSPREVRAGGGLGRAAGTHMGNTLSTDMGYTFRIGEAIALSEHTFIEPLREAAFVLPRSGSTEWSATGIAPMGGEASNSSSRLPSCA
jgi:hypothetical protein